VEERPWNESPRNCSTTTTPDLLGDADEVDESIEEQLDEHLREERERD